MKTTKTNNVSFTPGPWIVNFRELTGQYHINFNEKNYLMGYDDFNANVNLIAAAPEMLEALEDAINYLNCGDSDSRNFAKEIQLILNKAKGE